MGWKSILLEALTLAAAGLALSLTANFLSPRGLVLARDYFPGSTGRSAAMAISAAGSNSNQAVSSAGTNSPARLGQDALAARLAAQGLQLIDGEEVKRLFGDPQYAQELFVFVDARDDRHYQQGHVPGAYQFDRYYPEKHLPVVLPACLTATKVVVYCTGGNCEDSEFAALALKEASVPPDRLFVYAGGVTEWTAHGWPLESGERKSGLLQNGRP